MIKYTNQERDRSRRCTPYLEKTLESAMCAVYGPGFRAEIYSGGQAKKGTGGPRVGSIRHDDYGDGGRALDAYIYNREGERLSGIELAKLGQYWLAKEYGGCGLEMAAEGIHLDEWNPPPPGGGMFWFYASLEGKPYANAVKRMVRAGAEGRQPTLYGTNPLGVSVMRISASVGSNGVNKNSDVEIVQRLINENINPPCGTHGPLWPHQLLVVDGLNGPKTMGAIYNFQRRVVGMEIPDSRVDPNGRTIRLLNAARLEQELISL